MLFPPAAMALPAGWKSEVQSGDIIFIGGTDIWTQMAAAFSENDDRFGHTGILLREGSTLSVIEAGGFILGAEAGVAATPAEDFIRGATDVAVFRPALSPDAREAMLDYARAAAKAALPFDRDWRLDTADEVYCTEFVWRALSAGTEGDPVPARTRAGSLEIIALDDLLASPLLEEVHFTAAPR